MKIILPVVWAQSSVHPEITMVRIITQLIDFIKICRCDIFFAFLTAYGVSMCAEAIRSGPRQPIRVQLKHT